MANLSEKHAWLQSGKIAPQVPKHSTAPSSLRASLAPSPFPSTMCGPEAAGGYLGRRSRYNRGGGAGFLWIAASDQRSSGLRLISEYLRLLSRLDSLCSGDPHSRS